MKNSSDQLENTLPQRVRIWIIVFTAPIALFFSIWGYLEYHPEAGILNAIYHSFQLFILHTPHFDGPLPLKLEIGRGIALIITALVVIDITLYIFYAQTEWFKLHRMKNHTIICGLGDIGVALADNFKSKKKLIIVERNGDNENLSTFRKQGVKIVIGNAMDPRILQKIRIKKATCLYAVSGDDFTNLSIIKNVREIVHNPGKKCWIGDYYYVIKEFIRKLTGKTHIKDQSLEIIANIDSLNLKNAVRIENCFCEKSCPLVINLDAFYYSADKYKKSKNPGAKSDFENKKKELEDILQCNFKESDNCKKATRDVKYFDINELSAKYIFQKFPPDRFKNIITESDPQIHILFLGFSQTGEELLKLCLQNCHFINFSKGKKKTIITLIGIQINLIKNKLHNRCPKIEDFFELEFIQMNPHHLTHTLIEQYKLENVDIIYICASLDSFNESYSVKAREIFGNDKPIIRFFTKDVISDIHLKTFKNIHTIDLFNKVAKDELIKNGDQDRKAIAIHNKWLLQGIKSYIEDVEKQIITIKIKEISRHKSTLVPWHLLDEDFRDDNRSVIDHFIIKIRTDKQLTGKEYFEEPNITAKVIRKNIRVYIKQFTQLFTIKKKQTEDKKPEKPCINFSFIKVANPKNPDPNSLYWKLAEMEHRRWMATKYYHGWRYGKIRNDDKKVHPCLLEFDKLDLNDQQKDFDQIKLMEEIWDM